MEQTVLITGAFPRNRRSSRRRLCPGRIPCRHQLPEAEGGRRGTGTNIGGHRRPGHGRPSRRIGSGQVDAMLAQIHQRFGSVGILVNNAGIAIPPDPACRLHRGALEQGVSCQYPGYVSLYKGRAA